MHRLHTSEDSAGNSAERGRLAVWFTIGLGVAVMTILQGPGGDLAATLSVGTSSPARALIEAELGPVPLVPGNGHDGQQFYLVARDPFVLSDNHRHLDHAGFRYRRILYPLLAGGAGTFGPRATLLGLTWWAIFGMAAATAATASLVADRDAPVWTLGGVLANLGVWLSVRMVTADALALGLALAGLALWQRNRRGWGLLALGAAPLAKEAYALFGLGLAGFLWSDSRHRSMAVAFATFGPVSVWSWWVTTQLGEGFTPRGNLALPFKGILASESLWSWSPPGEAFLALVTLTALMAALVGTLRLGDRLLSWVIVPWIVLAVVSSSWVWDFGNNAIRAFAPLWLFSFLVWGAQAVSPSTSRRNLPV